MKLNHNNNITKLETNEVFVFGSNMAGVHSGGAAAQAHKDFGAVMGVSEGITGDSYALPSLNADMSKRTLEEIRASIKRLYEFCDANREKHFILTKVGCGIAGFEEEDILKIVISEYPPANISLPIGWEEIKGFKAMDINPDGTFSCRGVEFKVGETYKEDINPSTCDRGFHFSPIGSDVYRYYNKGSAVFEVEALGIVDIESDKACTNEIKIIRELSDEEARFNIGIRNRGFGNTGNSNTGNENTGNSNTGNENTGDWNTGDWNTGNENTGNSNTGNENTGNWNKGNENTGNWNKGNGNTGNSNTGNENTGDWNTGNSNTGNGNTGNGNTGNYINNILKHD
jgi:hypothetical protein